MAAIRSRPRRRNTPPTLRVGKPNGPNWSRKSDWSLTKRRHEKPRGKSMNDIVGTWRLVKTLARNDAGEAMHPPYGEKPRGLVVFYPDKRMMSVLCDGRNELPPNETVREYNSYCGNYEYDCKNLVTRVDASASKDRVGGEQK